MKMYSEMVCNRQPGLPFCFAFADGIGLDCQEFGDMMKQNAYYSYWKHKELVNNVLVVAPDGCVIHAAINFPGTYFFIF